MKNIYIAYLIHLFTFIIFYSKVSAQSIPVGTPVLDDYYRRMQLLGKIDTNLSFTVRPISSTSINAHNAYDPDSTLAKDHWVQAGPVSFAKGLGVFQILPLTWQQQFNSDHPYGWNDGAMIPAKGYQTMISGGFYFKLGPLSIQLRPEFVYAVNPAFNGYASGHSDQEVANYYQFHSLIDWPERYGNGAYRKAFWGQSSIRLTFGSVSVGLSNENLWWGPGISNALILTNNAPGFKHVTVNTVKPVKTPIGFFEGQIIGGKLENSNFPALLTTSLSDGTNLVYPARNEWRYLAGLNINYHPKWIPNFTLGFIRTFVSYSGDVKSFSDYIPFFTPFQKKSINNGIGDAYPREQQTSIYSRWLFPKAQAEVYFEYGVTDNSYNFNDFIGSPDHARAYVFGFRKMIAIPGSSEQHIVISSEITQLSLTAERIVRTGSGLWYVNYQLLQGDTQEGQVFGAGIGPGGNIQSMDISWVSGLKKLGIRFERYEHDVDFYHEFFPDINGNSRSWVDFAFGLQGEWNYKNLIFNAKLQQIKSFNYEWILKDYVPGNYYIPHNDVYNFHGELGVTFRF
ncbi:capsule assembly Wzi family protein [Mucilaginibacter sp.]|uniref:capsule assembly Wzi family protein n=1 Tax=Mucilaginibacter sp. TaxID=1882438 RepID=UPI002631073B|nr:capsule assembly Wzi family protein [Mucilaginibacter sp.]MDB4926286.1 hypothetical protein [Mucilaginibacter sp.]